MKFLKLFFKIHKDMFTAIIPAIIGGFISMIAIYLHGRQTGANMVITDQYNRDELKIIVGDEAHNFERKATEGMTDNQKLWYKTMLENEIEESTGASENEHLWALGSDNAESAAQHESYSEEHIDYIAKLENILSRNFDFQKGDKNE